jgi:beta-N-acetylhexosaminidase
MIMVRGDKKDFDYNDLNVGGIFLDRQDSEEEYKNLISEYQKYSKIKLFVATDMEGAWTPFRENVQEYQKFPEFSEISSSEEAYNVGLKQGELLKSIGFNLNFAPVAEYQDFAYGGRVFSGNESEVQEKVVSYIKGLQRNVFGTCKHYPGKSLLKNLHDEKDIQKITKRDLEIFEKCIENNVSSIMVSHQIALGEINSNGNPSSVSKEVISSLNDFEGLIIADEINMKGLSLFYPEKIDLYVDLINSGEEFILDFYLSDRQLKNLLGEIEKKVLSEELDELKIDQAVRKIFEMKGYEIE